jgi:prepilin-type N-terminal cleavage/methylation domain-containing protein
MVKANGFSLAEVIVALTMLSVAVLSVSSAAAAGARWLREAEAETGAALFGSALLDSIAADARPGVGQDSSTRYQANWTVTDSAGSLIVKLAVSYIDGTRARAVALETRTAPKLPLVQRVF